MSETQLKPPMDCTIPFKRGNCKYTQGLDNVLVLQAPSN